MVVVEHEDFRTESGKKRRRPMGNLGANRMLYRRAWGVMEDTPTRHFMFDVVLMEVRRARPTVNRFALMMSAQATIDLVWPRAWDLGTMNAKHKLLNMILEWLRDERKAGWTRAEVEPHGKPFVKNITGALF